MELYDALAARTARLFTNGYSSSFSLASRLFDRSIRADIYNIYGLVRVADEIVDTYVGNDASQLLDGLEHETYAAIDRGYSVNPLVHAFQITANRYGIARDIIEPFFASMRTDIDTKTFTKQQYDQYIYGSAEVVGLMCLRVFVQGDDTHYATLQSGARHLGAAYQKINFLRDLAADQQQLNRFYFPNTHYESFDDKQKQAVVTEIAHDLAQAHKALADLPKAARKAVSLSYAYYSELLGILQASSAERIKQQRLRLSATRKTVLFVKVLAGCKI